MLDSMNFEDSFAAVEDASETVLTDAEFRKRSASQRFEEIRRVAPLRIYDLIEFRNYAVLDVWSSPSNWSAARFVNFQLQLSSLVILASVHHLDDFLS